MSLTITAFAVTLLGYIGPGGGIALLGPLLGVILAIVGALTMVALWPLRYLLRRARSARAAREASNVSSPQA